jgi:uncharacterized protein (DUF2164 family)
MADHLLSLTAQGQSGRTRGGFEPCKLTFEEPTRQMNIEISKQARTSAIASLRRYFEENMPEPIRDLQAGLLLNFFLEEIGPVIYNGAIGDAQARLQQRVADLNGELYADEFQYWIKADDKKKGRK